VTMQEAMDSLYARIPAEAARLLPDEALTGEGLSGMDHGFFAGLAAELLLGAMEGLLRNFALIVGILLLSAVFSLLRQSMLGSELSGAGTLAGSLCLTVSLYGILSGLWADGFAALEQLKGFMTAMLPVMSSLYAAGGHLSTAAVTQTSLMAALTMLEQGITGWLLPLFRICFAFTLTGCVGGLNLNGVAGFIRQTFSAVLGFLMALFSLVLAYQNRIAVGADNVASRSIRFAASSFIPLVGGSVSEAVRTVAGSIKAIRSSVGWVAILVIALLLLPIIIRIYGAKIMLWAASCAARLLGCDREAGLLDEMAGLLNMLLAMIFAVSVLFLLSLTLFITAGMGTN